MLCALELSFRKKSVGALAAGLVLSLTGCALPATSPDTPVSGAAIQGKVYGGNQPVVGAHLYLMAAKVSGVGSAGYGLASTSLLSAATTGHSDSVGAYVLTDALGSFRLDAGSGSSTYDYTCPSATTQVYLYALGGNPGAGTNNAASFMAALGSCGSLNSSQSVVVNELTTVAAAYSLAGFATDALHVSIPQYVTGTTADTLAQNDLQNAFANANNLVNPTTGVALTTTPGGNGTPATAQVITLGNILAACINSNGVTTNPSNCYTLLNNAGSTGGATGTIPSESATAAINIAHYPYVSAAVLTSLYALAGATGAPFTGGDSTKPTDFTVAISFTGGGMSTPISVTIDGSGNVWVTNSTQVLSEFSPTGAVLSTSSGYGGLGVGGLNGPVNIAIDTLGNAWAPNQNNSVLSEFSSSGTAVSSSGYTGGGLLFPNGVAIDATGNVWVSNTGTNAGLSKFSSGGTAVSPDPTGYPGGGLSFSLSVAIDSSANVWVANNNNSSVSKFSNSGTAISPVTTGYTGAGLSGPYSIALDSAGNVWVASASSVNKLSSTGTPISASGGYTGGGVNALRSIAMDGAGNAWVTNYAGNSVSEFSNSGSPISPATTGYTGGSMNGPYGNAVDGSGNVWVVNNSAISTAAGLTELVGAATPVVTPVVANLIAPYTSPASRP